MLKRPHIIYNFFIPNSVKNAGFHSMNLSNKKVTKRSNRDTHLFSGQSRINNSFISIRYHTQHMKLISVVLLIVFLLAACSSDNSGLPKREVPEIQEVVLTPAEQGTLKLNPVTRKRLGSLGMTEFPGYIDPNIAIRLSELYNATHPIKSLYIAEYEKGEKDIAVHTLTFHSDNLKPVLDDFISYSIYYGERTLFLHNEDTIVVVSTEIESDLPLITEIANKLSQRLGMEVVDLDQPPAGTPEKCGFEYEFRCINHSIGYSNVVLWLENGAEWGLIRVRDVTVTSEALKGGNCTTGIINKYLTRNESTAFVLDKSLTQDSCYYEDRNREKNLYRIKITYNVIDGSENADDIVRGVLLARPPS